MIANAIMVTASSMRSLTQEKTLRFKAGDKICENSPLMIISVMLYNHFR